MSRVSAECFPPATFMQEELDARNIPLDNFLRVIEMSPERWERLITGDTMLISEIERIAGALHLDVMFLSNLSQLWNRWKKAKP